MSDEGDANPRANDSALVVASDGFLARSVGSWSAQKLFYVERYIDIFTTGMKNSWRRRVYVDLFCGPGRSVIDGTGEEILGSPLLALNAKYSFTDLYFNDADSAAIEALKSRATGVAGHNVVIRNLDCNDAARDAVSSLRLNEPGTLGLAVVDPTAFQITLGALEDLTRGRPIDLILTFMTDHIRRFMGEPSYEQPLDAFFGSPDWHQFNQARARGETVTYRQLLDFYEERLRSIGYTHVDDESRILNSRERTLYHLVFASKNPKGAEFFKKISRRKYGGQARLEL